MTGDIDDPTVLNDAPRLRTRDIFQKMDLNQDGVLSKEEFVKGCLHDETLYKLLACSNDDEPDKIEPDEKSNDDLDD